MELKINNDTDDSDLKLKNDKHRFYFSNNGLI